MRAVIYTALKQILRQSLRGVTHGASEAVPILSRCLEQVSDTCDAATDFLQQISPLDLSPEPLAHLLSPSVSLALGFASRSRLHSIPK